MATAKKTTSKKKMIDDNEIITLYMDQILLGEEEPKTVYAF